MVEHIDQALEGNDEIRFDKKKFIKKLKG